jgi:hypothetical protein
VTVALGANVISLAACVLFDTILVCHSVGADSLEAIELASHFRNMN